jgi:hypothetical protein
MAEYWQYRIVDATDGTELVVLPRGEDDPELIRAELEVWTRRLGYHTESAQPIVQRRRITVTPGN